MKIKMTSIPYSLRYSISNTKDFQNPFVSFVPTPIRPSLQYFNMRVTDRFHRYRSLKRQWHEVITAVKNDSSLTPKSESPLPTTDIISLTQEPIAELKVSDIKDNINSIIIKENNESNLLHSRIQHDLIQLRKIFQSRQKKFSENRSSKTNINNRTFREATSINIEFDDQDNNNNTINTKKSVFLHKIKTSDRVKISGYQMYPSTFSQNNLTDNKNIITSNSSSTCSQYSKQQLQKSKQQNNNKTSNISHNRINHSLLSDSFIHGVPPPKKNSNISPKINQNTSLKQTQSYRLPIPSIIKKKQSNFIKQETLLPPIQRSSDTEQTTCLYTYAASTSSATPSSMKLNRNRSLLPILLTSSSCIGIHSREIQCEENDHNNLLNYKQLINHLPKPIISIYSQYDQDSYRILFEQLDHIREKMPDSNVYDNYTRIY